MSTDLTKTRNIGIAAHIDAGKTTTTERFLYYTGRTHRMGDVDDGTTITDYDTEEQQRGITIYSAAVTMPWKGHTINLIDTPGHVDFTAEVERAMRVLDGAVVVFDGKEGVEAQSETVWRQASKYRVPRICFINKMDKIGADFFASVESIEERLGVRPVPVQIPIGSQNDFRGLVDLLEMQAYFYEPADVGCTITSGEIPDDLAETAKHWRHALEERVAEFDDALMEKYVHEAPLEVDEIRRVLRHATCRLALFPVLCGSALSYIGTRRLLDAVVDYLPSPQDVPPVVGHDPDDPERLIECHPDRSAPLVALVFKVVADKPVDLYYLRVYQGTLRTGVRLLNVGRQKRENLSRLFRMFAKRRDQIEAAHAGDIVAAVGLKESLTGDTLVESKSKQPVLLEQIEFPDTVINVAVEPKTNDDRSRMGEALAKLSRQDPTFRFQIDPDSGQTIISGMGELHLEVLEHRLMRDMGVAINIGRPHVAYRETVGGPARAEGRFVRQTGGRGQFAVVDLTIEPLAHAGGHNVAFESKIVGGAVSREYIPAVERGVREAAEGGILTGFPLIDVKVTLVDGKEHEVDSSELAFESAAALALRAAAERAGVGLLEPIMRLEVISPETYFGVIAADLNSRRAEITHTEPRGQHRLIDAQVPLGEMFGYATALRGLTQGRASWSMEPCTYRRVPRQVEAELLERL